MSKKLYGIVIFPRWTQKIKAPFSGRNKTIPEVFSVDE